MRDQKLLNLVFNKDLNFTVFAKDLKDPLALGWIELRCQGEDLQQVESIVNLLRVLVVQAGSEGALVGSTPVSPTPSISLFLRV